MDSMNSTSLPTDCPCGSDLNYNQCCAPFHQGKRPPTALQLMRSRFTAYALDKTDYLISTTWPPQQKTLLASGNYQAPNTTQWVRLEVLDTVAGGAQDTQGTVEFKAWFTTDHQDKEQAHHERSDFIRVNQQWFFIYPDIQPQPAKQTSLGRNDPCFCGSGKKYKKCCQP